MFGIGKKGFETRLDYGHARMTDVEEQYGLDEEYVLSFRLLEVMELDCSLRIMVLSICQSLGSGLLSIY